MKPSASPPQLSASNVIRGAVVELVLQDGVPDIPFDRRADPSVYRRATEAQLRDVIRPRATAWVERNLTNEVVRTLQALVERYNEFLRRHAGERMMSLDFYPNRPIMDPFEAMRHPVQLEPDVQHAVMLGDMERVAELGGAAASLDAVRAAYVRALTDTRDGMAGVCMPLGGEWQSADSQYWIQVGRTQLQLLPFVYRHVEEFTALHAVNGPVTDLPTHEAGARPPLSVTGQLLFRESIQERNRYAGHIASMRSRAERLFEEYREHMRIDSGRTGLGRALASFISGFPADDCRTLMRMLHQEKRLTNADAMVNRIHERWREALFLQAQPSIEQINQSYMTVYVELRDVTDLLEMLMQKVFDGYEGK